jgi:hypothetical protein
MGLHHFAKHLRLILNAYYLLLLSEFWIEVCPVWDEYL